MREQVAKNRPEGAFTFPMLDNGYVYLAATRLSVFRSPEDWALVIEVFGFSPRGGTPDTHIHTYASRLHDRDPPGNYVTLAAHENCRYAIATTDVEVDVMSPERHNVPTTELFRRAAIHTREYDLGDGMLVRAVSPPYFLALKLEAFLDRGEDLYAQDLQDIVALAVEVSGLVEEVRDGGIDAEIAELWRKAFEKHAIDLSYIGDLVDAHIRGDEEHRERVIEAIRALATG